MNTKEAFKKKMEAEIELAQAKLAELRAEAKSSAADARIEYDKQIEELSQKIDATKAKLKEVGEASEEAWEEYRVPILPRRQEACRRHVCPPLPS